MTMAISDNCYAMIEIVHAVPTGVVLVAAGAASVEAEKWRVNADWGVHATTVELKVIGGSVDSNRNDGEVGD